MWVGFGETDLEFTDDPAEGAGCEEAATDGTRRVLTDRWKASQGRPDVCRHVGELPANLIVDDLWPVGGRQAGGSDGIRGSA
jgi:hypothetical protein